jgi:hypothetical protein
MWQSLKMPMLQLMRPGLARNVIRSMDKDIYKSPMNGFIYSFSGYGGVMNCSDCDAFTQVNEYDREDGLVVWLCNRCENKHHL